MESFGVSVVIPAFGRAGELLRAIDSVEPAAAGETEIIVIDDGSPLPLKPSVPIRNRHGVSVRLYRLDRNRGPQTARNLGIRRARHRYVAFLDSDDVFLPSKLDVVLSCVIESDPDLVFHAVEGAALYSRIAGCWDRRLRRVLPFDWLITLLNPVVTPSLVVRRTLRLGPPSLRHAEDWAYLMRVARPGMKVVYLDRPLARLHRSIGSAGGQSAARWRMRTGEFRARAMLLRQSGMAGLLKYGLGTCAGCVRVASDALLGRYRRTTDRAKSG